MKSRIVSVDIRHWRKNQLQYVNINYAPIRYDEG
jgi:hypothetical protein